MTIIVQRREVYGRETIYPLCSKAKLFAELAGTKTLTATTLHLIRRLGYDIEQPAPSAITA